MKIFYHLFFLCAIGTGFLAKAQSTATLENQNFRVVVDKNDGALSSLLVKGNHCDLVSERRLMANFRICLQTHNNLANYIDGRKQTADLVSKRGNVIKVVVSGMTSPQGTYPIDLTYWVKLNTDYVSFRAKLVNHDTNPISEFWFPRIGGIKDFGNRDAKLAVPGYNADCRNNLALFRHFPGGRGLGAEAAEWSADYPGGMCMPWWDIYDQKDDLGLYLGYHDTTCRFSTWHMYLWPDRADNSGAWLTGKEAGKKPVGIVFSHVFYPFIRSGETFESGEFIVRVHKGDWHNGARFYRKWFMSHFPFKKPTSWLRKQSTWFSAILYQPEDKVVADFKGYNRWTRAAMKYGIECDELLGWDQGGIDRDYPAYTPAKRLGGLKGFTNVLHAIQARGGHCLVFVNYNMLDQNTRWYKQRLHKYLAQDQFGNGSWIGYWGESTLLARKGLSAHHIARSSIVPGMEQTLDRSLIRLVKEGAEGFQIDKVVAGYGLDFNRLNTAKPDVALCERLVDAIGRLYQKCRSVNPDFCMASEFGLDRLIPYFDVGYRNAWGYGISPLKYVFPEWTACQHVSLPRDFRSINGAVLTGSVIVVEPDSYQGPLNQPLYHDLASYVQEITRLRKQLAPIIFLGRYYDNLNGKVVAVDPGDAGFLHYKVWGDWAKDKRAIAVANDASKPIRFTWSFPGEKVSQAMLYAPFAKPRVVKRGKPLKISGVGLEIIVANTEL